MKQIFLLKKVRLSLLLLFAFLLFIPKNSQAVTYTITVHKHWDDWASPVKIHAWHAGGDLFGGWPGANMEQIAGTDWYTITFDSPSDLNGILFNDGAGHQSPADISVPAGQYNLTFNLAGTPIAPPTYYRSTGDVTWGAATNWEVSSDGVNYTTATVAPANASVLQAIVSSGNTLNVTGTGTGTPITTPGTSNFIVNGTLELGADGFVSTAPTYGKNSTLRYKRDVTLPATEWPRYATDGTDYPATFTAGVFPYNVDVASGTLSMVAPNKFHKQYMGGNLTIQSGAEVWFDMNQADEPRDGDSFRVAGNIDNYGTINQSDINQSAFSCTDFTNHPGATTTLSGDAKGGDLVVYGNFMNNGGAASDVNINGRALIFRGDADQILGGSAPGPYEIDYLIVDKSDGVVTVKHDIICDGEGTDNKNSMSGGGSITVMGANAILDLRDVTATVSENGDAKYWSTIECINDATNKGRIRTNAKTVLNIYGHQNNNTGNLSFDQTTPNVTNVIGQLNLDRVGGVLNFDNDFVVADRLQIQQGKLTGTGSIRLESTAIGTLSRTNESAALAVKDLVFTKVAGGDMNSAQFYKNGRNLTINGKVRTLVDFIQNTNWSFVSFPYKATATASDGTALTDFHLYEYVPTTRAQNISGWKESTDTIMIANKGYIMYKSAVGQVYFDGAVAGTDSMFNSSRTLTLTHTPADSICNAGWNFIAHPLTVNGIPTLATGQFAYSYDPTADEFKIYYHMDNPGYTYTAGAAMKPFDALFVKTPDATIVNRTLSYATATPQGVLRKAAQQAADVVPDEIIKLNLLAQGKSYETLIRVKTEATAGEDALYDAPYNPPMKPTTPRLYTLIHGRAYVLNSVPESTVVPVGIRVPSSGEYTLTWENEGTNYQTVLKDKIKGTEVDMTKVSSYTFTTAASGDINNRFEISVPQRAITNVAFEKEDFGYDVSVDEGAILFNNLNTPVQISIFDVAGKLVEARNVTSTQAVFNINRSGVYLLKVVNELGTDQMKVLVK